MTTERGDREINQAIDKCNQAMARVDENILRRANLMYYMHTLQGRQLQYRKDCLAKGINDADQV